MKEVAAVVGAAVAGVFVGALVAEVLHRNPDVMKNVWKGTRKTFASFSEAFREGYHGRPKAERETEAAG